MPRGEAGEHPRIGALPADGVFQAVGEQHGEEGASRPQAHHVAPVVAALQSACFQQHHRRDGDVLQDVLRLVPLVAVQLQPVAQLDVDVVVERRGESHGSPSRQQQGGGHGLTPCQPVVVAARQAVAALSRCRQGPQDRCQQQHAEQRGVYMAFCHLHVSTPLFSCGTTGQVLHLKAKRMSASAPKPISRCTWLAWRRL